MSPRSFAEMRLALRVLASQASAAGIAFAMLFAASSPAAGPVPPSPAPGQQQPALGTFGVDLTGMDLSVHPGDDFWEYVNGNWAQRTTIPPDRGVEGQVSRLGDLAASQVRDILNEMAARPDRWTGDDRRVVDYWLSLRDRAAIEALGSAPLADELAPALAANDHSAFAREIGRLRRSWNGTPFLGRVPRYSPAPFGFAITQDVRRPERYVVRLGQSGLGMPNRDFYLLTDPASVRIQEAYRRHVLTILRLLGVPGDEAEARSHAVYVLEHAIAQSHWRFSEARDPDKTYNLWSPEELSRRAPGFDWLAFLKALGLADRTDILAAEAGAIAAMSDCLSKTPLPVLKDWLAVRHARDRAAVLPQAFMEAELAFSGGVLSGAALPSPTWLQAVELASVGLTDAVATHYVARHFSPRTKTAIEGLVANVIAAMDRRFASLDWMQPATRERAREKLANFRVMIGYPERWRSYEGLEILADDAYGNLGRAAAFEHVRNLGRIDQPVDRDEWNISPMTANAVANAPNNQIIFAAAYLQPPHFDPNADPAVNYGAIGFVIGHEISHHFDDRGSRFDPDGRLAPWWSKPDLSAFRERTQRLVAQYDGYEVRPGLHIRGAQVLGENIADHAGLAIAYDAYRHSLNGSEPPVLEGFTGDQRFFLARAQLHRTMFREEELRQAVIAGSYAPSRWRVWSVRNHDAWYQAFDIEPSNRLYLPPAERVRVW